MGSRSGKKRQNWPISRSLTQNKPAMKRIHDLTLLHGARPYGAVVVLHGALHHGAMVFFDVAGWARIL
jgi:predicted phage tail protein